MCLIFIISISGCQSLMSYRNEKKSIDDVNTHDIIKKEDKIYMKEIKETTKISILYGFNSHIVIIDNQEEIKQLEELFNTAEFDESTESTQQPYLRLTFYGKTDSTSFRIDNNDVIKLKDGNYMKSKQISFDNLYSIFFAKMKNRSINK